MSEKEKSLPRPPGSAFGQKRFEQAEEGPLMADQIARAVAEDRLEEFMDAELPDNEYSRKLVSMMIGMTGMISSQQRKEREEKDEHEAFDERGSSREEASSAQPPDDVIKAVGEGDVKELIGLLEREHKKRSQSPAEKSEVGLPGSGMAADEKETIDRLIKIASENDLSPDWIVLRALRLYIQEYERTGRL
jgi:hypothetical protein